MFTTSLDAALRLVPAKCGWQVGADSRSGQCSAELAWQARRGEAIQHIEVYAASPAPALCIVALKTRHHAAALDSAITTGASS
jgi:hypothetical protein